MDKVLAKHAPPHPVPVPLSIVSALGISDPLFSSGQLQVWPPTLSYVGFRISPKMCHCLKVPRKTNTPLKTPVKVETFFLDLYREYISWCVHVWPV